MPHSLQAPPWSTPEEVAAHDAQFEQVIAFQHQRNAQNGIIWGRFALTILLIVLASALVIALNT